MSNVQKLLWLSIIIIICVAGGFVYNYTNKPTVTTREQCFNGSIDACVTLDKTNKQLYRDLEITQQQIAENNKAIKAQASRLLSWSSFH